MSTRKRRSKGIADAVEYFTTASTRQKYKGNTELTWALETIEHTATMTGLSPEQILSLVDVAAAGVQVETVCKRLLKALVPTTSVPEMAVIKCISWLCTNKPSINMKCMLVRWILVIYDYMDRREKLHSLYGPLFHFLHYRTLCPYVCHLLYLLTRKEDVKLYRVRHLVQYQKDMGGQPFLTGLLSVYRHYYPSMVHVVNMRSYKSFFPNYDQKWSAAVRRVREASSANPSAGLSGGDGILQDQTLSERLQPGTQDSDLVPSRKRRKVDPIPLINSLITKSNYRRDRLGNIIGDKTVPFVLIQSFKRVLDNIDCIEFPSQIGAVLRSEALKHVMSFTKDPVAAARFQFWVAEAIHQELTVTDKVKYKDRVESVLKQVLFFSDFLKEGIPAVDSVLAEYLQDWNGQDYVPWVLQLVSRCHLSHFDELNESILEPLRRLFFCSSVYFKCKVIRCFTDMLWNHAAFEWPRTQVTDDAYSNLSLFDRSYGDVLVNESLTRFISYMCKMILAGCVEVKCHQLYEHCALDFLDVVSSMHKDHGVQFVYLNEVRLFERLFISRNPHTVSRLCSIVCRYKENFSLLKKHEIHYADELASVRRCNQLITVVANCLWRFKAYTMEDKNSVLHWNPASVDKRLGDTDLSGSLSVIQHPALLPCVVTFVREKLGEHALDLTELKYIKKDIIHQFDKANLPGLQQFVSTFLRSRPDSTTPTKTHAAPADMSAFGF